MTKDICFFIQAPLTGRDYDRLGIEILRSRGFKVSFLDLTMILNPEYVKKYTPPDPIDFKDVCIARKWHDISGYLKNNDIFLAVDLVGATPKSIPLYRILKKYKIRYANFCANSIPASQPSYKDQNIRFPEKIRRIFMRLKNPNIIKDIIEIVSRMTLLLHTNDIQRPAIILEGGKMRSSRLPKPSAGAGTISAHTLDYDIYLKHKSQVTNSPSNDSIVFLDEYNPFHPDFLVNTNTSFSLDPDVYYGGLSRFFSYLEKRTGLPVKIAAHPRSRYDLHPDFFQGREVILGKTIELVYDAKFILAHASTAINFAVLYKKPIIFLTSDQIIKTSYGLSIRTFASQFNKIPVNVDDYSGFDIDSQISFDNTRYEQYRSSYIKSPGSPDKFFWDIVADYVLGSENGGARVCL